MEIQTQVPLAQYTTLKVGGPAQYLCEVTTVEELEAARQFATQTGAPLLVLGSGSNVLVRDEGFSGLVIINKITGVSFTEEDDQRVVAVVGAGEVFDYLVSETVTRGYWGLENLSHIPGTVGATPVQNVGAYGVEVSELISSVTAFSMETGEVRVFSPDDCQFAYRESFFKTITGRQWVITSVSFVLSAHSSPRLEYKDLQPLTAKGDVLQQDIREQVISVRAGKFPDWHIIGTAGSFFKNPIVSKEVATKLVEQYPDLPTYSVSETATKLSLGWILDHVCGLKGYQDGDVALSPDQALVLLNTGSSAAAIEAFVSDIQQRVLETTGVSIEQEVRTV